jgi:hypothetical protein
MGEAELNQAKIKKLEAEAESTKIGIATEGQKIRIQEINSQIGLQRERREGILSSIDTMNKVYSYMTEDQKRQQPSQMPQETSEMTSVDNMGEMKQAEQQLLQ